MLIDDTLHLPGETPPPHTPADVDVEEDESCPLCGAPEGFCDGPLDDCPYREDDEFDHIAWAKEARGRQQHGPR